MPQSQPDFRQEILSELKRGGAGPYDLIKRLRGKVPAGTLYDWLGGKTKTINSIALQHIFQVMRIGINWRGANQYKWIWRIEIREEKEQAEKQLRLQQITGLPSPHLPRK